jgi:hypothetical protein
LIKKLVKELTDNHLTNKNQSCIAEILKAIAQNHSGVTLMLEESLSVIPILCTFTQQIILKSQEKHQMDVNAKPFLDFVSSFYQTSQGLQVILQHNFLNFIFEKIKESEMLKPLLLEHLASLINTPKGLSVLIQSGHFLDCKNYLKSEADLTDLSSLLLLSYSTAGSQLLYEKKVFSVLFEQLQGILDHECTRGEPFLCASVEQQQHLFQQLFLFLNSFEGLGTLLQIEQSNNEGSLRVLKHFFESCILLDVPGRAEKCIDYELSHSVIIVYNFFIL